VGRTPIKIKEEQAQHGRPGLGKEAKAEREKRSVEGFDEDRKKIEVAY